MLFADVFLVLGHEVDSVADIAWPRLRRRGWLQRLQRLGFDKPCVVRFNLGLPCRNPRVARIRRRTHCGSANVLSLGPNLGTIADVGGTHGLSPHRIPRLYAAASSSARSHDRFLKKTPNNDITTYYNRLPEGCNRNLADQSDDAISRPPFQKAAFRVSSGSGAPS